VDYRELASDMQWRDASGELASNWEGGFEFCFGGGVARRVG